MHLALPGVGARLYHIRHALSQGRGVDRAWMLWAFIQEIAYWWSLAVQKAAHPMHLDDIVCSKPTHKGFCDASVLCTGACVLTSPDPAVTWYGVTIGHRTSSHNWSRLQISRALSQTLTSILLPSFSLPHSPGGSPYSVHVRATLQFGKHAHHLVEHARGINNQPSGCGPSPHPCASPHTVFLELFNFLSTRARKLNGG